jgi:hypothetical protein
MLDKDITMKTKILILVFAVCAFATPSRADLFTFTYSALDSSYSTVTDIFSADLGTASTGTVSRIKAPIAVTTFDTAWGGPEDFDLTMNITNIGGTFTTADGDGTLTLTDVDSDTISANISGSWGPVGAGLRFDGVTTDVTYTPSAGGETTFDGDFGSVSMEFGELPPWSGSVITLTGSALTFENSWTNVPGAGVTGTVVPVPAAVLLGAIGLSVASIKLRKFA